LRKNNPPELASDVTDLLLVEHKDKTTEIEMKGYDPLDTTLKFVTRRDDLDPISEMSCSHAVTPESLTQWCRNLLDQGHYTFKCPALVEGTTRCNKAWSYQEVRRLADLSVEEMQHFEDNMARMAAARHCEFQPCPQCKTNMERKDLSNLCVICIICTADQGGTYQFCWQCQKPWKGSAPRSDRCGNDDCINRDLQLLQTCKSIDLPEVAGVTSCPSIRFCPKCGMKIEHSRQNCKNVICPRCHKEFCFVCLKLTRQCCKTSSPFRICPGGVAPRQTSIPVWQRK
uniref:RING-type domain-containing protein n=1 Tax=Amphiprion percula TaxID=161767 RepID=A0A3P8T8V9_AMPPE